MQTEIAGRVRALPYGFQGEWEEGRGESIGQDNCVFPFHTAFSDLDQSIL